ncbi:MAG: histidine--tRNA ligase [Bacteroidetes bacterium]|nr:histidine--tRNA ligase [Rhodothermia bacterium]MCS7155920.1 histidine--tRNA ligase [Bacteroidota bacterium]MCX7905926.1 histidine--tRNA ligase [Bacteroidota bacterium]MDW8138107.1 histidine--tRNA ligase [Bacteroidota bacterium]MDW8285791.1 histidine--tRNA ligase [Bacteroidota bacterium]
MRFRSVKGTHDILPQESARWQHVEGVIRSWAERFGFREIRTPILEPFELIARGVGQTTDIVTKEMFTLQRGQDLLVLRPEMTAPVMRAYLQHGLYTQGAVQKWYYIGAMFRAERPQRGRQRQFHQYGAEVIGSPDPTADAEVIALQMGILEEFGLQGLRLRLNSIGDEAARARYREALLAYFRPLADRLSPASRERLERNPLRILDSKEPQDQELAARAPRITEYLSEGCRQHFEQLKRYLEDLGIAYEEDPLLVRGLDYYSRTAFEVTSPLLGAQDALGGGGRYDGLAKALGGPPTPGVGFAGGLERLLLALEASGYLFPAPARAELYIAATGAEARRWALVRAQRWRRQEGLRVEYDLLGRSIKAQLREADRMGARFVLFVGDQELRQGLAPLKELASGEQTWVPLDEVPEYLRRAHVSSLRT